MGKKIYIDVAENISSPSALTQEQGDIIYHKICSAIEEDAVIHLDFEQVESMISPFLNNAIGQLYGKYTSEQIQKHLVLEHFPSEKNATLNIVISNAKKYYADKDRFNAAVEDVINS